jgi:class 3 adenylate cyclase
MDYTIIGDAVNTAARLETLTRSLSKSLLISDVVKQHTKKKWDFIKMGEFELKGKDEKVQVWSVSHNLVSAVKNKQEIAKEIQHSQTAFSLARQSL